VFGNCPYEQTSMDYSLWALYDGAECNLYSSNDFLPVLNFRTVVCENDLETTIGLLIYARIDRILFGVLGYLSVHWYLFEQITRLSHFGIGTLNLGVSVRNGDILP